VSALCLRAARACIRPAAEPFGRSDRARRVPSSNPRRLSSAGARAWSSGCSWPPHSRCSTGPPGSPTAASSPPRPHPPTSPSSSPFPSPMAGSRRRRDRGAHASPQQSRRPDLARRGRPARRSTLALSTFSTTSRTPSTPGAPTGSSRRIGIDPTRVLTGPAGARNSLPRARDHDLPAAAVPGQDEAGGVGVLEPRGGIAPSPHLGAEGDLAMDHRPARFDHESL
jgi:hypothetical protein